MQMIGSRVDDVDEPRIVRSKFGWWFIGNQTWTLLAPGAVLPNGSLSSEAEKFLRSTPAFNPISIKSYMLTVLTSTDCNLGCGYCYQNQGLDEGGGHRPPRIRRDVLRAADINNIIQFARIKMREAEVEGLSLVLFGGEPLLNVDGCLRLLIAAREVNLLNAVIVTNGVLLKERVAVKLEQSGLGAVQITLDGCSTDHDRIRAFRSGAPSYDIILRNVAQAMLITGLNWQFRVNVSHHNFENINNIFGELVEAGIDPKRCGILFAWVGDKGFGYSNHLELSEIVRDAFVQWNIQALRFGFRVPRPSMKRTCQTCSSIGGKYGGVVSPDGKLYSCWQSAGKPEFQVGDLINGFLSIDETRDRWVSCGYEFSQSDQKQFDKLHDGVDGMFLDYLHEQGQLY